MLALSLFADRVQGFEVDNSLRDGRPQASSTQGAADASLAIPQVMSIAESLCLIGLRLYCSTESESQSELDELSRQTKVEIACLRPYL